MGHFDTEAEPPLDAVLVEPEVELELELAVEPELEPPALLVLLGLEPVVVCGSVGVEASVIGVTVCTHGVVGVVGVAGEVALEEVVGGEEAEGLAVAVPEEPALLVEDASVAVPETGSVAVEHTGALLTPLGVEPSAVDESVRPEAPVDGARPAPPAVGL